MLGWGRDPCPVGAGANASVNPPPFPPDERARCTELEISSQVSKNVCGHL